MRTGVEAPQLGECAVVVGQGILGQLAVQFLRLGGCEPVIAVDLEQSRLALARRVGAASHYLNPGVDDVVGAVHDLTAGRGGGHRIRGNRPHRDL